ncbi:hypothetical protein OIT44_01010 [Weissella ceti]|uniref:DUF998 domain-containing protein n=1 Tax=Weissella ceti TaxID=759620 RepID=A0ABT3E2J7_9LACO|nr:hypothetical protein [Weissella ceti]MCW0952656.1 hypothetical protein [Weissella ceti]QVK12361.1 hypothetical protein KHQ31_01650 [Weissella ceti]
MIIRNLQTQKWLLGLSAFSFVSLTLFMLFHNPWISLLDTVTAQLNTKMLPKLINFLFNIIYSFNTGFLAFIVIFLMAFFLWGFKFKIPAAWIGFTSAAGFIVLSLVNLIIPHHVAGLSLTYPAHAPFWVTLIYSYWVIFIQPELTILRKRWRWGLASFWVVAWLITMLYSLFQPNVAFSDILAGWFLAVMWLEASEMLYVRYVPIAIKMPVFYNSWY